MKKIIKKGSCILLFIAVLIVSIFCLKESISFADIRQLEVQEQSKIDYYVYLKENDYFEEDYLPAGRQYIASLIDYIAVNFHYTYYTDKNVDMNYSYDITGTVIAHEPGNESQILYQKDYVLKDLQQQQVDHAQSFTISDDVQIDYDQYNQIISEFKSDYALSLDSYLQVKLNIHITTGYDEFKNPVIKNESLEMKIPLTEQTIQVGMQYKDINQSSIVEEENQLEITNIVFFFFFWVGIILEIFVVLALVRMIEEEKKAKGHYRIELDKIQKHYDRAIVETKVLPSTEGKQVVVVSSFEELMDARENVEKPILHYRKKNSSIFIIVDENIIYQYILK